jgi:hypothetical protein
MRAPENPAPTRAHVGRSTGDAQAVVAFVEPRAPSHPVTRSPSPSSRRPARPDGDPEPRIVHRDTRSRRAPRELPV